MFERERLEHAEAELTRAAQRLWELRRLTLCGEYDTDEFDRAVITYRTAARAAQDARAAAYEAGDGPPTAPAAQAGVPPGLYPGARLGIQVPPALMRAFAADAASPAPQEPAEPPKPQAAPLAPTPRMRFVKWLVETGRLSDQ